MEGWLQSLFENSNDALFIEDPEGRIVDCNPAAETLRGVKKIELIGKKITEIVPAELHAKVLSSLHGSDSSPSQSGVRSSRIRYRNRDAVLLNVRDIENQRDAKNGKRKRAADTDLQRLETLGRLAGGVIHDFNNLLTVIIGRSEIMLDSLSPNHPMLPDVMLIHDAADRAASVTRQLLAFRKQKAQRPRVLDLNTIILTLKPIILALTPENVRLTVSLQPDAWRVEADRSQMEQVLMNLVINAIHAMPEGGELEIRTSNEDLGVEKDGWNDSLKPGRYLVIAVRDTGIGMDAETAGHIFEPFFTTKGESKGTGLGLATVHKIVEQTGGGIKLVTAPGKGTTFIVGIPGVDRIADPLQSSLTESARGAETLLLVEDSQVVRKVARDILETRGYRVIDAASGEEALTICQSYSGPIDLILSDVVMPRMSGRELLKEADRVRPGIKILLMSGYADEIIRNEPDPTRPTFLEKPFTANGLAMKVREALDSTK